MRRRAKTFGKDVGQLRSSLHVSRHKNTTQDAIAQLVGVAKDMLGAFESDRVSSEVNGGAAVNVQGGGRSDGKTMNHPACENHIWSVQTTL